MNNAISDLSEGYIYGTPGLTEAVQFIFSAIRGRSVVVHRKLAAVKAHFDVFEVPGSKPELRAELEKLTAESAGVQNAAHFAASLADLLQVLDEVRHEEAVERLAAEQKEAERKRLHELMA